MQLAAAALRARQAEAAAAVASSSSPIAPPPLRLRVPDLPGAEVYELSADVAVDPRRIEAVLHSLRALLLAAPAPAAGERAAEADPLAAACWCAAPHARLVAPFPDPLDARTLEDIRQAVACEDGGYGGAEAAAL